MEKPDHTPAHRHYDPEAEAAVLGSVLLHPPALPAVRLILRPDDFYDPRNAWLFGELCRMEDDRAPIDLVATYGRLIESGGAGRYFDLGTPDGKKPVISWLTTVFDTVPTGVNAEFHARTVADHAARRRLMHTLTELLRDTADRVAPVAAQIEEAERRILALGDRLAGTREPVWLRDELKAAVARVDQRARAGEGDPGRPVRTGIGGVDEVIGGWRRGVFYVLAARPSVGKSAFALGALLSTDRPSLLISLEMTAAELADRALAWRAEIPLDRITAGEVGADRKADHRLARDPIDPGEVARLFDAGDRPTPVLIDERPAHTPASIASTARRAVARHGVEVVVVDYLQLVKHDRAESQNLAVGRTAKALKYLARELNVAVVCLAQMNREIENRPKDQQKPRLSDLRDSGETEQDADVVLFLSPGETNLNTNVQDVTLSVAKQRNGPRRDVELEYHRAYTKFFDRTPT